MRIRSGLFGGEQRRTRADQQRGQDKRSEQWFAYEIVGIHISLQYFGGSTLPSGCFQRTVRVLAF